MDGASLSIDLKKAQDLAAILPHSTISSNQSHNWRGLSFADFHHPSHEIPEYFAPDHTIIVGGRQSGRQQNRIDGRLYTQCDWQSNDANLIVIPAGVTNFSNWTANASFSIMSLCPIIFRESSQDLMKSHSHELIPQFIANDQLIYQMSLSLNADIKVGFPTGQFYGEAIMTMLVARLLQSHSNIIFQTKNIKNGLSRHNLRRVLEFIDSNISEELNLKEISNVSGLSPFYFLRCFKESMNVTPHQYIVKTRIERAKLMLRSNEIPISEISLNCGFLCQSHFTNAFRKFTNTTPLKYRREFS
jgi:AraC family transcriptional regulator